MIASIRALLCVIVVASSCYAAPGTISGTVRDGAGAPFRGAFVRAKNSSTKVTMNVLTDGQGRFRLQNLPQGDYDVRATAIGFQDDLRAGVRLAAQPVSLDFKLENGTVQWSDLSTYQGRQLLPKTKDHDLSYQDKFFTSCFQSCHSFQKTMAPFTRDESGWLQRVRYMRDVIIAGEGSDRMSDAEAENFASYMTFAFGPNSPKPASPASLPEYKKLVRSFSDEAMKIVYVEYDFAGSKGLGPWSAVEAKDGTVWMPYYGRGNEVVRLNPETGELTRFLLPFTKTAGIHSAIPAPDGTVWFTEAALGRV